MLQRPSPPYSPAAPQGSFLDSSGDPLATGYSHLPSCSPLPNKSSWEMRHCPEKEGGLSGKSHVID